MDSPNDTNTAVFNQFGSVWRQQYSTRHALFMTVPVETASHSDKKIFYVGMSKIEPQDTWRQNLRTKNFY
jgi:hypothetical protein